MFACFSTVRFVNGTAVAKDGRQPPFLTSLSARVPACWSFRRGRAITGLMGDSDVGDSSCNPSGAVSVMTAPVVVSTERRRGPNTLIATVFGADDVYGHIPVLPDAVMNLLHIQPGMTVLDGTAGAGGHTSLFCDAVGESGRVVCLDVDPESLNRMRVRFGKSKDSHGGSGDGEGVTASPPPSASGTDSPPPACRVDVVQSNFRDVEKVARALNIRFDAALVDLGVSSMQLDMPDRGFSFRADAPLDMRMDPTLETTAADLVNKLSEREMADLFFYNSQETKSRRIANRIYWARKKQRITTTTQLSDIICKAVGVKDPNSRRTKIHPATRVFQALRMAVNDEMGALADFLEAAPRVLSPGGRLAVIAFHSVEDKLVKTSLRQGKTDGIFRLVTKKPVVAEEEERRQNPRSRSAKLRVAEYTGESGTQA